MSDLDAFLAGIVAEPANALRWLVMADYLDDHGQHERAELVRVHRELLRTCTDPEAFPERAELHARMMELLRGGAKPTIPERTLTLPGGVELRMSFIPPGSFLMGSPETEADREEDETLHLVTLTRGFWLGQTPVTQAQWRSVMGTEPSQFKGDELPVETVSWDDAQAFCARVQEMTGLAARLPSEGEWEYACRSGTTTPFYWGGELNGTQANINGNYPDGTEETGLYRQRTSAVGSYTGVSPHPWGLMDVVGNVWEWCGDWWDSYPAGDAVDSVGPENGSHRVFRGGCWDSHARDCRAAYRYGYSPDERFNGLGFRLAVVPSGE